MQILHVVCSVVDFGEEIPNEFIGWPFVDVVIVKSLFEDCTSKEDDGGRIGGTKPNLT